MKSIKEYDVKRNNLIVSIGNDYEMLAFWECKEFVPLERLNSGDRLIVVLSGFNNVHDMLEDVRNTIIKKRKSLDKLENKILKLKKEEF